MASILGAMGSLAPKLLQLLESEYELQKNVREKLKFVHQELETIRPALNKVAAVPWDQLDEQVKVWACQVRDASYDMEDVLDAFLLRVEGGKQPLNRSRLKRAMKKMGGLVGKFMARRGISGAIDDIQKQLQGVAERRARYKIDDIVANPATVDPRLAAFYTKASQLVGIDEPRDELTEMLSIREDDRSSNEMKIVSIAGFGGLGKTTLAKAVYEKVSHQFDCGAFVPVGRDPDQCKVLRDVLIDLINDADDRKNSNDLDKISSIHEKGYTGADLISLDQRQLIYQLRRFLRGKRYFIVIDDIWDLTTWEVLKIAFADSDTRSRIIATTRNSKVAELGTVYRMKKLPESESRKLLYTRTFGAEETWPGNNDEVSKVSQKILDRCDGVPLAIITIGSLLAGKQIEEWSNVYDSVGFGHGDNSQVKNMEKILSFSYYDLPSHLRTCLLYLSVFPEDYAIGKGKLIWMWIGEGLVQTEQGKDLSKVGESYFLELINRGMIQPDERYGVLDGCRVHDMVLHMIRNLSRDENFSAVEDSKQWSQGSDVHRLALHRVELSQANHRDMKKLRSFNAINCGTDNITHVSRFKLLRVLYLESCRPLEGHLDTEYLGKLLHLRYLDIRNTPIRELSKEIGNLKFLQTVVLNGTGLEELPTSLKQLKQLKKLLCLSTDDKIRVPDWIYELTSLEVFSFIGADGEKCCVKELGNLTDLRQLHTRITLQDEGEVQVFLEALSNLEKVELINIVTLKPFFCKDAIMQPSFVLHCNNLHALHFGPLNFSRLPKWINPQALPKLCQLTLNLSVLYQKDVEILGKFENLCYLHLYISGFSSKVSIVGGGRFQNLRYFKVAGLCQLELLKGAVPRLEEIWLRIPVCQIIYTYDLGLKFGLENISALQSLEVGLDCACCFPREVEEVEAELRRAVSMHPNRPTLQLTKIRENEMVTSSDSVMERQRKREQRLRSQIGHLKNVHNAIWQEVAEMGDIKTDLNPSDAKNKVHRFFAQFGAIRRLVEHEVLPMRADTPINDHDVNKLAEDSAAMERGLEILSDEYPRLSAMVDALRCAFSSKGTVPRPQVIALYIDVDDVMDNNNALSGLGNHRSLEGQAVKAHIDCALCFPTEVESVETELRHAIHIQQPNNPPTIEIIRFREDKMVNSDSQMLEREKWKAGKLWTRIGHQKEIHDALQHEAVKMGEQITNLNLSDDTKTKVQEFYQRFTATVHRVKDKLLPVEDCTHIHDHDLNRVLEDIKAMEQALEILNIDYPLYAAMLDELRYPLSLQGAMPMPQVINLNIHVCDIMVHKELGLDFGLLGMISSLRGIKAHVICELCFPTEVEEVEAKLRQAVDIHHPNNPPTLEVIRYAEDKMVNSDSDSQMLLQRQLRRRTGLVNRVNHHKHLHNTLKKKVVEIVQQKTIMTLSDAAKHKEQRFREHFAAIVDRVKHELLRLSENIPNRDLKRLTEENEDLERALQILTVEYPRLAEMLEELKSALGLEAEHVDEVDNEDVSESSLYNRDEEDEMTEEEDEVTDEEGSEAWLYDTEEEDEMTEEEVSAASLSGREYGNEVTDDEVSVAWLFGREEEDEITKEEEVSAASLSDKEEADEVTEDSRGGLRS